MDSALHWMISNSGWRNLESQNRNLMTPKSMRTKLKKTRTNQKSMPMNQKSMTTKPKNMPVNQKQKSMAVSQKSMPAVPRRRLILPSKVTPMPASRMFIRAGLAGYGLLGLRICCISVDTPSPNQHTSMMGKVWNHQAVLRGSHQRRYSARYKTCREILTCFFQ